MIIIGIAGGVASGKSLVSDQLESLGAVKLDADRMGHEVLREPKTKQSVRDYWGSCVFEEDGEINRKALAERVFAPTSAGKRDLLHLEKLTHPLIDKKIERRIRELSETGITAAIVDAAVMFKAGWDKHCDKILFVESSRQARLSRARLRGWSEKEFEAREASQDALEYKRQRSDITIDNNGSIQATAAQVNRIWSELVGQP